VSFENKYESDQRQKYLVAEGSLDTHSDMTKKAPNTAATATATTVFIVIVPLE